MLRECVILNWRVMIGIVGVTEVQNAGGILGAHGVHISK